MIGMALVSRNSLPIRFNFEVIMFYLPYESQCLDHLFYRQGHTPSQVFIFLETNQIYSHFMVILLLYQVTSSRRTLTDFPLI